jgi:hypothetical protein
MRQSVSVMESTTAAGFEKTLSSIIVSSLGGRPSEGQCRKSNKPRIRTGTRENA